MNPADRHSIISLRRRKIELCASAAIGAIVLAVTTAGAQSYNATPTVIAGDIGYNESPGVTDVQMNSTSAVLRWDVPAGTGTYDFQTSGTTTFHNFSDFTVLNVVNTLGGGTPRAIKFNGATVSEVNGAPGGNVWFYSPGGMIVGSTASFNVGSLLLTTARPSDQSSSFSTTSVSLSSIPAGQSSAIVIEPGASIAASNYIAMVAPRIEQGGTVRAGGEIAYVAAEDADIIFPTGSNLFNIDIGEGTGAVNAQGQVLVHTGTSGGPGADANTPNRNIYFVAMPKNTAVTTLLSGSVGYDAASGAAVNSEGIYLVGGGVIIDGEPFQNNDRTSFPAQLDATPANLTISGATFQQAVTAHATNISTQALTGDVNFARGAVLNATLTNNVDVASGRTLRSGGNLSLFARGYDDSANLIGGTISTTIGGMLQVGNGTLNFADTSGLVLGAASAGASGNGSTGGSVTMSITGGDVVVGLGGITLDADAIGGSAFTGSGGNGTGGSASMALAGTLNTSGDVVIRARGSGGASGFATAGQGTGGTAQLTGTIDPGGANSLLRARRITITARGTGGVGECEECSPQGPIGGAGQGGSATINVSDTNVSVPDISVSADGIGGDSDVAVFPESGAPGGDGTGGLASATFTRGVISSFSVSADADGVGGNGGDSFEGLSGTVLTSEIGGRGGNGTGGKTAAGGGASVSFAGSTLTAGEGLPSVSISARGTGGTGGYSDQNFGGAGGDGVGGDAAFFQSLGAQITGTVSVSAVATGGQGGSAGISAFSSGGNATGGSADFSASDGGTFSGAIYLNSTAEGGLGGGAINDIPGFHGAMLGGTSDVLISGTSVSLSEFTQDTSATTGFEGGVEYHGAHAIGGATSINVSAGGSLSVAGDFTIHTSGSELGGDQGAGNGEGGAITIRAMSGGSITAQTTQIDADGYGGASDLGTPGRGTGGAVLIEADNGAIQLGTASISAFGGGGGGDSPTGGDGIGGSITLNAKNGGTFGVSGGLTLDARGTIFADGAAATGGTIALTADGGQFVVDGLTARSSGNLQGYTGTNSGGSIAIIATGIATAERPVELCNTSLEAIAATTSGTIAIRNDIGGGASPLSFGALTAFAAGATTDPVIQVSSVGSAITADSAVFNADGSVVFSALAGGTISAVNDFNVTSDLSIAVDGDRSSTPTIEAGNLTFTAPDFNAQGATILKATDNLEIDAGSQATAGTLIAGNSIYVHSAGNVAVDTATVTGEGQPGESGIDESVSRLQIEAGYSGGLPGASANLTINVGTSAGGLALLRATGDVNIANGAVVRSDNILQVNAGDDIVIGAGAIVAGSTNPIGGVGGSTRLVAGDGTGAAEVHSLINDGTIGTGASLLNVRADAIQSRGTLAGRSITASLTSGSITGDDGGALLADCTAGTICIGSIAASGPVTIGTTGRIPITTRISGNVSATTLNVRAAAGIFLGGSTPSTMTISGATSFNAGTESLNGAGSVTINAGSLFVTAGKDIAASGVNFRASGNITLNFTRDLLTGDIIAGGQILPFPLALTGQVSVGGELSAGAGGLDLSAAGPITINKITFGDASPLKLTAGGDLSLSQVSVSGAVALNTPGAITALGLVTAADVVATAGRGIVFANLSGASATLTANGGDITGGTLTVAGTATLQAVGAVRLSDPVATGTGSVPSANAVTQGAADSLGNGGDLVINATGDILVSNAVAGGRAFLTSGGAVSINALRSGGDLSITAPGNIGFATLSGNTVALRSTAGAISGQSLAASFTTNLSAAGLLQVSGLSSADAVTATGGGVTLQAPNALTLASLTSTGAVLVNANSLAVNGQVQGTTIELGSQSISIGANARIGTAGTTTTVTFRNTGSGRSFIGATGTGYSLASAGLARVQADTIALILPQAAGSSPAQPDVLIGDLTLNGSTGTAGGTLANLTSGGSFTVQTPGRLQVAGKLTLTSLGSGNSATLSAGQGIDVVTPGGQILLTDSSGNAQGILTMTAPRIVVASASAMTDLASLASYDQREARLASNDGAASDQGYLAAGRLVFRVASALHIQNSGASSAPADRRGFTAGTGGIDVVATGSTLPEIILNGRQAEAGSSFTGGFALRPLVRTANGSGSVDATSVLAVNGCTPTRCSLGSPVDVAFTLVPTVPPPQDVEDLVAGDEETAQILPVLTQPLIALPQTTPYSFAPVVDEPVTGVGVETVSFGTGPDAANGPAGGNVGTGNVGTGNEGGPTGAGSQNGNVGTGNESGGVGTGPENGNVGTGNENGNVGTGPEGNGAGGNGPSAGPQNGNLGSGNDNGGVGTGRDGSAPTTGPQNGGNAGVPNGSVGDGPQNDNVGTGPNDERSQDTGR